MRRTTSNAAQYSGKNSWATRPVIAQNQVSAFCYDTAGNVLAEAASQCPPAQGSGFTYNAENQLTFAGGTNYVYDGDGNRVEKYMLNTQNQIVFQELYWYGGGSASLDETDGTGSTTNSAFNEYVFFDGARTARRNTGGVYYYFADHLGTAREIVQSGSTTPCYDADFTPYGVEMPNTNTCAQNYKFTGKERDTESGLDNFEARYDSSSTGRFLSPDPLGGHFMNPQSLNRYAYVHNNPLNLIDPNGLDCIYLSANGTSATVQSGDCSSETDNGIYVDGTVNPNSFNVSQSDDGDYSLNFGYTNYDSGNYLLTQTDLTEYSSPSPNSPPDQDDQLSPDALQIFAQVYQSTRAVTNPKNIAAFYGASAVAGAVGVAVATYGTEAASTANGLLQLGRSIALNPDYIEFASDFIQGATPGPVPATLGGLAGFVASEVASHLSEISEGAQNSYQQIKASVPH
jgi:RHS repeat-associated protein